MNTSSKIIKEIYSDDYFNMTSIFGLIDSILRE